MNKGTVFLIEGDDDARPIFRKELKKLGYRISLAVDREDALERVRAGAVKADLLLINIPHQTPSEILETARDIASQGQMDVPIVVIAAQYGEDLEGKDVQVSEKEYITYLEVPDQLSNLLSRLISEARRRVA